jgi:hypothetical protein
MVEALVVGVGERQVGEGQAGEYLEVVVEMEVVLAALELGEGVAACQP